MNNTVTYLNAFKAGDLISSLPGIKHIYDTTGAKGIVYQRLGMPEYFDNTFGTQCMGLRTFESLKPLIEHQDYIEKYIVWEGESVMVDFTPSRDSRVVPLPNGSIHHYVWSIAPEMQCNLFIPWIDVQPSEDPFIQGKVIINRTARYQNPYITYFFLKKYQDNLVFAGTEEERDKFCEEFKLSIPWIAPYNFLELARLIKSCRFFLGSQSALWHVADAQKTHRLLEASTTYPNTYPTGNDGYFFHHQKAAEILFEKLFNQ